MNYSELTRQHFTTAAGAGVLSGDAVVCAEAGSAAKGTWVQFDLRVAGHAGGTARIAEARFLAFGCPHTIAVADWLVGQAIGRGAEPALPESVHALQRRFDVPIEKLGRLLIVEDAWIAAMRAALTMVRSAQIST